MALIRSLTSGTSSLKAHQQRLDIISNNIANVNTTGYKSSRATFAEQFNQVFTLGTAPNSISGGGIGGIDPLQIGLGVKLGAVTQDFSQGSLQTTNRPMDLALQGEGFFAVEINGQQRYTRAGAFSFDTNGNLVDSSSGAYVQGYNLQTDSAGKVEKDGNGNNSLNRTASNIQVSPTFKSAPRQTGEINMAGNINSQLATGESVNSSITIYDSQGTAQTLKLEFTKLATPANSYSVAGTLNGDAITHTFANVTFGTDGTMNAFGSAPEYGYDIPASVLNNAISATSEAFDEGTATTPINIRVNLTDANNLLEGLTQFSGQNTVTATGQDGYATGELSRLTVDQTGRIIGAFSNGQSELLGQVVVAKFTNPGGLVKEGGNYFSTSPNSGLPNIGTAVEIFPSTRIASGALEESNVDLTEQFTDLISTQRAFEAASRTVTISDQFLNEINGLKR